MKVEKGTGSTAVDAVFFFFRLHWNAMPFAAPSTPLFTRRLPKAGAKHVGKREKSAGALATNAHYRSLADSAAREVDAAVSPLSRPPARWTRAEVAAPPQRGRSWRRTRRGRQRRRGRDAYGFRCLRALATGDGAGRPVGSLPLKGILFSGTFVAAVVADDVAPLDPPFR